MATVRSLSVFCGSSTGINGRHREAAAALGTILAEEGVELVYGGARIGLMGVLADAALGAGGRVVGVMPENLKFRELAHPGIDDMRVVASMHARKQKMFEISDACAVLPGGFGTLDETFEIITWKQIGLHDKPIVLVDSDGYWKPLSALLDHVIAEGFARPDDRTLFTVVEGAGDVLPALAALPEPAIRGEPDRL
ncbi:MAG: TIGR00730 family Rossman fold protein [Proteobacteria bacterium]|nr:TIGR00730 family Rossman fold protein [Pseudomonadota bacterium]